MLKHLQLQIKHSFDSASLTSNVAHGKKINSDYLINQNKVGSVCKGEKLRAEARSSEEKYIYWSTVGEASGSLRKLP